MVNALARLFEILLAIVPVAPFAVMVTFVPLMLTASPPSPIFEMPLDENVPVTVRALLTVVSPVRAPIAISVAAPPIFSVETVSLKIVAVVLLVVIEPPFTAMLPVLSTTNASLPEV